jgi:ketosteroid isomerase-like protein
MERAWAERRAKSVCADRTVIVQCLGWALERGEPYGVWGGLTPAEREALRPEDIGVGVWSRRTVWTMARPPTRNLGVTGSIGATDHASQEARVLRVLYRYCYAIDSGDVDGWVDTFADDGVFEVRMQAAEQSDTRVAGHDDLRQYITDLLAAATQRHRHLALQPLVTVTDRTASVQSYIVLLGLGASTDVIATGIYHDEFVRSDDDEWRFRHRLAVLDDPNAPR